MPRLSYVAIVVLGACSDATNPPHSEEGRLLITRGLGDSAEIYSVDPDGSNSRRLTRNGYWDGTADWSPDRREIAFASARDTLFGSLLRSEIFIMNADGSNQRKVTESLIGSEAPRWSPDGTQIVFERFDPLVGNHQSHVMTRAGANVRRLVESPGRNYEADWSPSGDWLVFVSTRLPRGWASLYLVRPDGSDERQLAGDSACDTFVGSPRWSPDGSRIVYFCATQGAAGLYVINADGTNPRRVHDPSASAGVDVWPTWSPDSRKLAFTRTRAGWLDVFIMDAHGGPAMRITHDADASHATSWR